MFTLGKRIICLAVIGMTIFSWSERVSASVIANGGFETGDYSGWALTKNGARVTDSTWAIVQTGETVVLYQTLFDYGHMIDIRQNANCLPMTFYATEGTNLAAQLQNGPVVARMRQDITLPAEATALTWDMAYTNKHSKFLSNQSVAIHIRDLNDVVLDTIFITGPDSPLSMPMSTISADIARFAGQTVRLDVEVNVGVNFLPASFDNFRVEVTEVETVARPTLPPGWGMGKRTGWQGPLPPGLEKLDKIPPGFENGQKNGFQR